MKKISRRKFTKILGCGCAMSLSSCSYNPINKRSQLSIVPERIVKHMSDEYYYEFLADNVFGETVDYLSNRELIKNIDFFYQDRLNLYIPLPSAVIISNMYAERVPINIIDNYISDTRRWINDLTLNMDTLNYSKLLDDKLYKHQQKRFNQSE